MASSKYNDQVFINCPFDEQYQGMFRACVFTVLDSGFVPRCSLEVSNATVFRLQAIVDMIRECRYGIHDLSRVTLDKANGLPRFNMPFELGIFYGAKHFGTADQRKKDGLVLEKERFRYQKFISDLAGVDVNKHKESQKQLSLAIREWLVTASRRKTIPQGDMIYDRFRQFQREMAKVCKTMGVNYSSMPFVELVSNMTDWLKVNQVTTAPLFGRTRKSP